MKVDFAAMPSTADTCRVTSQPAAWSPKIIDELQREFSCATTITFFKILVVAATLNPVTGCDV